MHIPAAYSVTDELQLCHFMKTHSFAIVVSAEPSTDHPPTATHVPLLVETMDDRPVRLVGHMARANSQWQQADGHKVLAVFSGPHSYISAGWYGGKERCANLELCRSPCHWHSQNRQSNR